VTYIPIRIGKWDIQAHLKDGTNLGTTLAYLVIDPTPGVPWTIAKAYSLIRDRTVLLGFPDILFDVENPFADLLTRRQETGAEVVLGLFPGAVPHKSDMVAIDERGRLRSLLIKPAETNLELAWALAVWGQRFTQFLYEWTVTQTRHEGSAEKHVGHVIQSALSDGVHIDTVVFHGCQFVDLGTPEDLERVEIRS
jgi:glucose-1-phosphate thymidylyltransferase